MNQFGDDIGVLRLFRFHRPPPTFAIPHPLGSATGIESHIGCGSRQQVHAGRRGDPHDERGSHGSNRLGNYFDLGTRQSGTVRATEVLWNSSRLQPEGNRPVFEKQCHHNQVISQSHSSPSTPRQPHRTSPSGQNTNARQD
jgi:hypothetical protein